MITVRPTNGFDYSVIRLEKKEKIMFTVKKFCLGFCLILTFAFAAAAQNQAPAPSMPNDAGAPQKQTLYARLGGYGAIDAVVDDFVGRLVVVRRVPQFFVSRSGN